MAGSLDETENISDLVASNTSLNVPRNLAYAAVERANLLNLSKLCIKNLIESSLSLGRSLGEDHLALQQFFVIIEHVLRHGLKGRYSLRLLLVVSHDEANGVFSRASLMTKEL